MIMNDQQLLKYSLKGLIPGPSESKEEFSLRCNASLSYENIPRGAGAIIWESFSFTPEGAAIHYDNKGLFPWQGGLITWNEGAVSIQVRKSEGKKIFNIYSVDEIIAHECIHFARREFSEPLFEEILAYQTSPQAFRRYFAPLFRTPLESHVFISFFFVCIAVNLLYPFWGVLPLFGVSLFYFARLYKYQKIFKTVRSKLARLTKDKRALLKLTDDEFVKFAKLPLEQIKSYIEHNKEKSLRLRQLALTLGL